MFEKIMEALAGMNDMDKMNDYFVTKRSGEYILSKRDVAGIVWDIGRANDGQLFKKIVWQTYGEIYYKESE